VTPATKARAANNSGGGRDGRWKVFCLPLKKMLDIAQQLGSAPGDMWQLKFFLEKPNGQA
jgi:hypothetical protein